MLKNQVFDLTQSVFELEWKLIRQNVYIYMGDLSLEGHQDIPTPSMSDPNVCDFSKLKKTTNIRVRHRRSWNFLMCF